MFFEVIATTSVMFSVVAFVMLIYFNKRFTAAIDKNAKDSEKQIEDAKVFMIEHQKAAADETRERLNKQNQLIENLIKDNEDLKKKLEFFTEIESDSKKLNEVQDHQELGIALDKALLEISANLPKTDANPKEQDTEITVFSVDDVIASSKENKASTNEPTLDADQRLAYMEMETTRDNFFITGKAGTGKSFLLTLFEKGTEKRTLKVSPTGIAALNIGGATIHSIFGFTNLVNIDIKDINAQSLRLKPENREILRNIDTLIIDEISMVSAGILDKIEKILRIVNNNDQLFGGKQILIFGDMFQLPPITKPLEKKYLTEKYGGIYFFLSKSYKTGGFRFIELNVNHRQEQDIIFFDILNRMREGAISEGDRTIINRRLCNDEDTMRRVVRLFPTNAEADRINRNELDKIPAHQYSYQARVLLNETGNNPPKIEGNLPIVTSLNLKLGALVMMVNNDIDKRWVNGTLGIISAINNKEIKVKIDGKEYDVQKYIFESRKARLNNGKIEYDVMLQVEQFPIILAYAITIHKSQGMTYQRIACDITSCFTHGQAYVALSRCSSLNGLHLLKEISDACILVDAEVKNFYLKSKGN